MQIYIFNYHTSPCDNYSFFYTSRYIFLNNSPTIIKSPYYYLAPSKLPLDCGLIKSLWISLVCIWISNFCDFITSPVVLYLILTWSFVKGELTTWVWLKIQLCTFSIVYFLISLPFIVYTFISMIFHLI